MIITKEMMQSLFEISKRTLDFGEEDTEVIIDYHGKECILDEVKADRITLIHRHTLFSGDMYERDADERCFVILQHNIASDEDMKYVFSQIKAENVKKIRLAEVEKGISHFILLDGEDLPERCTGRFIKYDENEEQFVYVNEE